MAKVIAVEQINCTDCLSYIDPEAARIARRLRPCMNGKGLDADGRCTLFHGLDGRTPLQTLKIKWGRIKAGDVIKTSIYSCRHNSTTPEKITVQGKIIFINKHYMTVVTSKNIKHTILLADVMEGSSIQILQQKGDSEC